MKLRNITALTFLLFSAVLRGQTVEWTKTYGGPGQDGGESMVTTSDGGIVITGFISPGSVKDVLLIKTDAAGNELWRRIYNPGINDIGRSVKQTSDGGFIIAGMTEVSPQIFDPFLIKTDSGGNVQWQQQYDYGFGDDDRGHSVFQTSDGGYAVAGQTWLLHGSFGNYDMYIFKTDMNGNVQWKQVYFRENEGNDVALGIQQLNDGGYIIGGFTQSSAWASYIIRTDASGNSIWSNIYPGEWQSECYDVQATPDGGFIFTGTESSFTTDTDLLIMKLNSSGTLLWKKIFGTVDAEQGEYIKQLPNGYVIAGMSSHSGTYDFYIVRTDLNGTLLWSKTLGGTGDDRAFTIESTQSGSLLAAGWAWSYGEGLGDVYLVKLQDSAVPVELLSFRADYDKAGVNLNWSTATETNNRGFEVQRREERGSFSTIGFVEGAGTTSDMHNYIFTDKSTLSGSIYYRLKQIDINGSFEYSDVITINIAAPQEFMLAQNYPNPFNPSTTIEFSTAAESNVELKVFNVLGKEIRQLLNETRSPGNYKIRFDASALPAGVYYYKLTAGNFEQVRKMILLK